MTLIDTKPDCIILAGGEGKRMNGEDKGLILYNNKPLIASVIEKIKSNVSNIVISANRNIEQYEQFGYTVVSDPETDLTNKEYLYQGPMAGIAAALPFCSNEWVFVIACDMPLISDTVITQLRNALDENGNNSKTIAVAEVSGRQQLAILINKSLLPSIQFALKNNQRKLMQWVNSNNAKAVAFSDEDEFRNFNYFKDLI